MNQFSKKLTLLRVAMKDNNLDAYIVPSTDPHLGEYVPDHWREIAWLTGFSGSSATVIVTDSFAGLWTDSRYFIQAENQLADTEFVLVKPTLNDKKDYIEWLAGNITSGSKVGLDGRLFSITRVRKIRKALEEKKIFLDINCDLISELWTDRPEMSDSGAFDHSVSFCGKDRSVKIAEVRKQMKSMGVNYHLLTSPDDIMWLLNIRGNDVKYCPLLMSFAIVNEDQILLFVEEDKIPMKLAIEFDKIGIIMLPYEETEGMLSTLSSDSAILVTPGTTSASLFNSIPRE